MPFNIFSILFSQSTIAALYTTKNSIILRTYNQSSIEQLGVCTVRLRSKNKTAICKFFVVQGEGLALIWMPDFELLVILKIICEVMGNCR